jgi:hypothetical protein
MSPQNLTFTCLFIILQDLKIQTLISSTYFHPSETYTINLVFQPGDVQPGVDMESETKNMVSF